MIIHTSALLAIFLAEPERKTFLELILSSDVRLMSAANVFETVIVLEARKGEAAGREFDLFLLRANISVEPVDAEQIEIARLAWRKYGKGRHSAGLNFGDCFAYALTKSSGQKLLAKGNDFQWTDLELCAT
jgi:ribonuclease VapC